MTGGGGGSILGMIISYRNNRNMLRKKKAYGPKRKFDDPNKYTLDNSIGKIDTKPLTESERMKYHEIAKKINQRSRRVTILVSIAAFVLFSTGVLWIAKSVNLNSPPAVQEELPYNFQTDSEKFDFYISEGDYWFNEQYWDLAFDEYKKALILFPDDYTANYKLVTALLNDCLMNNNNCIDAQSRLNSLIGKFPSKAELFELRASYYISRGETEKAAMDYSTYDWLTNNE